MAENRLFLSPNMTLTHDHNFDNRDTLVNARSASPSSPTHQLVLRCQSHNHYAAVTVDNAQSNELTWWSAMIQTKHPLARMALDFLSTPGKAFLFYLVIALICNFILATSTDVECSFLQGGLTVSKMRHSLSDKSTRAATVLSSWCDFPPAIPRDDIVAIFIDKSKRPKGEKGKETVESEVLVNDSE